MDEQLEIPRKAQKEKNEQKEIPRKKKICVSLKIGEFKGEPLICSVNVNPKMLTSQLCEHFCLKNPDIVHPGKYLQLYLEDRILPNQFTLEYNLIYDQSILTGVWKEEEKRVKKKEKEKTEFRCRLKYKKEEILYPFDYRPTTNISTILKEMCISLHINEHRRVDLLWRGEICQRTKQFQDYSFQQNDLFEIIESFPIYIHSDKYPVTMVNVNPYKSISDIVYFFKLLNQIECKQIFFSKDTHLLENEKKIKDYDIRENDIIHLHRIQIDPLTLFNKKKKELSFYASSAIFNAPEANTLPLPPSDFF